VFADPDLAGRLATKKVEPWRAEQINDVVVVNWGTLPDEGQTVIGRQGAITTEMAQNMLGEDFTSLEPPKAQLYAEALRFQMAYTSPMHLMVTRLTSAIMQRATRTGAATAGLVSPEEAALIVLITRHHHERHVSAISETVIQTPEPFGWYSGLAQLAMPRYLPLLSKVVDELEAAGRPRDRIYDCFEGIFKRVRQLLRIHDRLGWLQLVESLRGTNNPRLEEQTDLIFNAVTAVQSALDGFTVMLVTRAGIVWKKPTDINTVGFRALNSSGSTYPWRDQFGKYQRVADICKEPVADLLDMALNLRRVGFHYHPLLSSALSFNEWFEATDQSGGNDVRSIDEETAGSVRFGQAEWSLADVTYGIDGMIPVSNELFALPWGFVRGLLRETLSLLGMLFYTLADVEGVTEEKSQGYFSPSSPYARFMLRWDQLALGAPGSFGSETPREGQGE
jgi:hypothetical protein